MTGRYALSRPIVRKFRGPDGEREDQVAELTLRKPYAGDLRSMDGVVGENAQAIALIAHLTSMSTKAIDELPLRDFAALGAMLQDYKSAGWPAGTVSPLELREPLAGDLRAIDQVTGDVAKSIALVARLAGVEPATIDAIEVGEFEMLAGVLEGFTPPGPAIGRTPSAS